MVEPHTHADPELKSSRRYTNWSARDVLEALRTIKGYIAADVPSERTMRDILNRMGYPIERCWSILEQKWGGALLNGLKVILQEARRMT